MINIVQLSITRFGGTMALSETLTVPPGDTAAFEGENCRVTAVAVGMEVGVGGTGVDVAVGVIVGEDVTVAVGVIVGEDVAVAVMVGDGATVGDDGATVGDDVAVAVGPLKAAEITARDSPDPGVARMNVWAPVPLSPPSRVRLRVAPVALNADERSAFLALERLRMKNPCSSTPLIRAENGALVKPLPVNVA